MVDFLIIGTQKSATTTIANTLNKCKQIHIPKNELHYFDKYKIDNVKKYNNNFINNKINGEKTPIYLYFNESLDRIKSYKPDIKIIISLRNPIYRAFSQYNMDVYQKLFKKLTFDEVIEIGLDKIEKEGLKYQHTLLDNKKGKFNNIEYLSSSLIRRGLYDFQLDNVYSKFSEDNICIILFENLNTEIIKVYEFLNINNNTNLKHDRKTIYNKEITNKTYNKLLEFYYSSNNYVKNKYKIKHKW